MVEIIVNADDFGISKGVNYAVFKGGTFGILNSASLMVNQKYTEDAVRISKAVPQLKIGLHLNFTNGYSTVSAEKVPLLTDGNGKFVNGFIKLLLLTLLQPRKMKYQIWREVEAQILEMKKYQLSPVHVDGHRHIQTTINYLDIVDDELLDASQEFYEKHSSLYGIEELL